MANIDTNKQDLTKSSDAGLVAGDTTGEESKAPAQQLSAPRDAPSVATPPASNGGPASTTVTKVSHPKKFSSVNINKKFLENNSATPSQSNSSSTSSSTKVGIVNPKPVSQTSVPHPRLITTKLTTSAQTSSLSGPGWSRPSSVTPTLPNTSSPTTSGQTLTSAAPHSAPQLPHVGKVIHPQPRSSLPGKKDHSAPVWGMVKGSSNVSVPDLQTEFPTAAEVAQVRSAMLSEKQEAAHTAALQKQAMRAEADAFRGVHLDPNAHHWDEMEEDDDNFLAEVIDFGDGRQYTVQHTTDDPRTDPTERPLEAGGDQSAGPTDAPSPPMRKEDRFRDDFDRSWPPSKPHLSPVPSDTGPNGQSPLSPNGSSKALFNDRSNKLEPYSGRQSSHHGRRGNRDTQSPIEPRGSRDLPPHTPHLLQKHEPSSQRQRRPGNMDPPRLDTSVVRDGKSGWREGHSPSSSIASSHPSSIPHGHPRRWSRDEGPGRRPSMSNGRPSSRDFMRPPPASTISPSSPSRSPQLLREERLPQTHSPSLSTRSLSSSVHPVTSPAIGDDEILQAAMHNAAERARIRRQQEEQEREKEKERARKKAEELAAKMEAQKAESEAAQIPSMPEITKPAWGKTPPAGNTPIDGASSHPSSARRQQSTTDSVASQLESWRAHAAPLPLQLHTPADMHGPLIADNDLDSLSIKEGEDVETVDFLDLGKLISGPERTQDESKLVPPDPVTIPSTDLVDARNREPPIPSKSDTSSWRRKQEESHPELGLEGSESGAVELTIKTDGPLMRSSVDQLHPPFVPPQRSPRTNTFREASMNSLDDALSRIKGALDHIHEPPPSEEKKNVTAESQQSRSQPPTPVVPPQTLKPEPPKSSRWLPPALRPRDHVSNPFGLEVEEYVTKQPLLAPLPEVTTVVVPKFGVARGPLTKRQFGLTKCPPNGVRWDILTWDPPVEGMSKRDFSLNEVLFRKPAYTRGKSRPRVNLPRSDNPRFRGSGRGSLTGAFGRPRGGDDAQTWRRAEPLPGVTEVPEPVNALDTVSVSPPPVPQDEIKVSKSPATVTLQLPVGGNETIGRQKTQRKVLVGEDVAFYRTRVDAPSVEAAPAVSFTVSSELDNGSRPEAREETAPGAPVSAGSPATRVSEGTVGSPVPMLAQSQADSKSSDASPEAVPITPPQQHANGTWTKSPLTYRMKESPARAPDPEHLKIVWSKSESKDPLPSVNSLEGIVDDLTNVPFSLQDVKSEDGETPPPTAPSRMSLSEVTRAFQQVPANSRPIPPLSSSVSSPPERQHNFAGQPPSQQQNNRPPYGPTYSSPLMSHSPAPGQVMYTQGSPVPGRMVANGHTSPYMHPQPVWVPVHQGPAPPGQTPGSMMRAVPSPFPNQVVTYPPGMYGGPPPPMTNGPIQQQPNGVHPSQGRGRGSIQMLSPIMAPANAVPPPHQGHPGMMYPPSPALMQPQLGVPGYPPHMQQHPGGNGGVGRGQMRNGYDGMPGMHGHPPPHPPSTPGQGHPQPLHPYPMSPYRQPW